MTAALDGDARILHGLHGLHIDPGRGQKRLSQSLSQFVVICIQALRRHVKHLAHQGETIAVHAGRSDGHQHIAGGNVLSGDHVLLIHHAHGKARDVVVVLRHHAGMFCGLTAHQSGPRHLAALGYTLHDGGDLLGTIPAAGYIIQEKQGFSPCTGHIVDTHGHAVNANGIMPIQHHGQLQLGTHAVRAGKQHRMFHILDGIQGKSAGKTAQPPHHLRAHGLLHMLLHQFHRSVARLNIHASLLVIHM